MSAINRTFSLYSYCKYSALLRRHVYMSRKLFCSKVSGNEPVDSQLSDNSDVQIVETVDFPKITVGEAVTEGQIGQRITVQGWIKNIHRLKDNYFLLLSDGLTAKKLQIVVPLHVFGDKQKPDFGAAIVCQGTIQESKGYMQKTDLICEKITTIGHKNGTFPFNSKTGKFPDWRALRTHIHLRPKNAPFGSLIRFRSEIMHESHAFMRKNGYTFINTPILTQNECEGGSEAFIVKPMNDRKDSPFFEKPPKLTVSHQLHLETAACSLTKVYTIAPTFRAEHNYSRRHLAEFTMFEVEEAFIDDLDSLMDRAESILRSLGNFCLTSNNEDLAFLNKINKYNCLDQLIRPYFRVTYKEAIELLNKRQTIKPIAYGDDISPFHESVILKYFENRPTFITHFPKHMKPFYMKTNGDEALNFDLIAPNIGEICGGSLREENLETLQQNIEKAGIKDDLDWYLDLRRFGTVPHGGFGFGFDRLIQTFTGLYGIRDVVIFPRYPHHCNT